MNTTLERALEAYGGEALWRNAKSISAEFSAKGLAFALKRRPHFSHAMCEIKTDHPSCRTTPVGKDSNLSGVLENGTVYLEDQNGKRVQTRENARDYFPGGRRMFWWDDLDMSYFGNYAMWNYLAMPALFLREDISWEEVRPGLVKAVFPETIPTHCRTQFFHFDTDSGYLQRHDYTAEVIGGFASAAHRVLEHKKQDGVLFTSHRRVTPLLMGRTVLTAPTLIEINVHSFKIKTA